MINTSCVVLSITDNPEGERVIEAVLRQLVPETIHAIGN